MKITVIIPAFNERATLRDVVNNLVGVPLEKEILIVDDGSTDGSSEIIDGLKGGPVQVLRHARNCGKGLAIQTALARATGDVVIIQDADLEYDPKFIVDLVAPIRQGVADAVFGSRILGGAVHRYGHYYWGGRLITAATNLLFGLRLTDVSTGHKAFRTDVLRALSLSEPGFGFCVETASKLALGGYRIKEVPITYAPRKFKEGKKIRWTAGLYALWVLVRIRLTGVKGTSKIK